MAAAGFISGYEGSPLGGYDLELHRQQALLDELDIVFRPGVNEELAATAVQGTQLAASSPDARVSGVFGLWYGKSPGLDQIRGYEQIKMNAVARYRESQAELRGSLARTTALAP
jgi:TPP-dependent indolepyruvate ferredoxin oxidoreductase alpha subunit